MPNTIHATTGADGTVTVALKAGVLIAKATDIRLEAVDESVYPAPAP